MANSTQIITDLKSVYNNGPSSVTQANSNAAAGPIMDYIGNVELLIVKAEEMQQLIKKIITNTDATTDATNLSLLQGVQNDLV